MTSEELKNEEIRDRQLWYLLSSITSFMMLEPSDEAIRSFALGYQFGSIDKDEVHAKILFNTMLSPEGREAMRADYEEYAQYCLKGGTK